MIQSRGQIGWNSTWMAPGLTGGDDLLFLPSKISTLSAIRNKIQDTRNDDYPQDEDTRRRSPHGERKLVKQGNIPHNIIIPQVGIISNHCHRYHHHHHRHHYCYLHLRSSCIPNRIRFSLCRCFCLPRFQSCKDSNTKQANIVDISILWNCENQVSVSFEDELEENSCEPTRSPISSSPSSTSSSPQYRWAWW